MNKKIDIDWKELHRKAGLKKYLHRLSTVAQAMGLPEPEKFACQLNEANGSAIFYHHPTVQAVIKTNTGEIDKLEKGTPKKPSGLVSPHGKPIVSELEGGVKK